MFISPLTGDNRWTKCHSLFLLALITLGIQKLALGLCVFPSQVLVLKKESIKLCFRQHGIQPKIAVIFQGTWRGIAYFEKQSYKDDVLLFWKNKAWENRRVFLECETHTYAPDKCISSTEIGWVQGGVTHLTI